MEAFILCVYIYRKFNENRKRLDYMIRLCMKSENYFKTESYYDCKNNKKKKDSKLQRCKFKYMSFYWISLLNLNYYKKKNKKRHGTFYINLAGFKSNYQ
jgi:hypothetical protein